MPQWPRGLQPDDGVGAAHSGEEAAPTRPLKRKRHEDNTAGSLRPRSLPTPPASQPQTLPNSQTYALDGTVHPQFDPSPPTEIALHQAVPLNGHLSPDSPDRERRGDVRTGLHPDYPIHVSSSPTPQTEGVAAGLTLPELSRTVREQLATLIKFGSDHWPQDDILQFQPGKNDQRTCFR